MFSLLDVTIDKTCVRCGSCTMASDCYKVSHFAYLRAVVVHIFFCI